MLSPHGLDRRIVLDPRGVADPDPRSVADVSAARAAAAALLIAFEMDEEMACP
jgi:hypothetical protein